MRSLWNLVSDPGLHFLAIALLLVYLTFGGRSSSQVWAESPLAFCQTCHVHHLPDLPCECEKAPKVASVRH